VALCALVDCLDNLFPGKGLRLGSHEPERKVRTPQGGIPRESAGCAGDIPHGRTVSQKTNRRLRAARVKRRGKSPPRIRQRLRHDKPNPVQGKIRNQAARLTIPGMPHPSGRAVKGAREMKAAAFFREENAGHRIRLIPGRGCDFF